MNLLAMTSASAKKAKPGAHVTKAKVSASPASKTGDQVNWYISHSDAPLLSPV